MRLRASATRAARFEGSASGLPLHTARRGAGARGQAQPGQLDLGGRRARVEPQHFVVRLDGIGHFPAAVVDDGQGEMRGRGFGVGGNGGLGSVERLVELVLRREPPRLDDERRRVVRHARQHGVESLVGLRHAAFGVVQRRQPQLGLGKRRLDPPRAGSAGPRRPWCGQSLT